MLAPSERPLPSFMLFKTLSAAVFGIDAYLVEVEVDVGSARMNDFNVVGLPDNAVKESRERIKSALRNCGIEFPYGQGVTINLAPADVKKEGSAFDLPMALGLAGCMGQFFGKPINKMMFLGELSLDGSIRPVRGALSAALAARESGLIALAVPEANAREAAVVDGIKIYAVKTLPQTVDLVNAPESFSPIQVDAQLLLSEAADIWCRPPRSPRPAIRQARSRSRLRRWPQHSLLEEAIETTRIHSVAGTLEDSRDRVDIHIEVPAVKYKGLRAPSSREDSAAVRARVIAARNRQSARFSSEKKTYANAQMPARLIRKQCAISADGEKLLENAIARLGLSARAHDRILKVARTIADLDASDSIEPQHLSEAIQYRTLDRAYWA